MTKHKSIQKNRPHPWFHKNRDLKSKTETKDYDLDWTNKYSGSYLLVGQRNLNLSVQTSRTQQCRVESIWSVGGHYDLHSSQRIESVHLVEQFHQCPLDLTIRWRALGKSTSSYKQDIIFPFERGGYWLWSDTICTVLHSVHHSNRLYGQPKCCHPLYFTTSTDVTGGNDTQTQV